MNNFDKFKIKNSITSKKILHYAITYYKDIKRYKNQRKLRSLYVNLFCADNCSV